MNNIYFTNEDDHKNAIELLKANGIVDITENYSAYKAVCDEEARSMLESLDSIDEFDAPLEDMISELSNDLYSNDFAFSDLASRTKEVWEDYTINSFSKKEGSINGKEDI